MEWRWSEGGIWGGVEERGLSGVANLCNADGGDMEKQREEKKGEKFIWTREFWQWWHSGNSGYAEGGVAAGMAERDKRRWQTGEEGYKNEQSRPNDTLGMYYAYIWYLALYRQDCIEITLIVLSECLKTFRGGLLNLGCLLSIWILIFLIWISCVNFKLCNIYQHVCQYSANKN